MLDLFIDIGNSRIKLATLDKRNYDSLGAFSISVCEDVDSLREQLESYEIQPDHVYISSVSDGATEQVFNEAISQCWALLPIMMQSQIQCCGIANGYKQPHALGVDRWMAIMGASSMTKKNFLVIDAGTAITVDAVAEGKHLGGLIVPGIRSMRDALSKDTAQLQKPLDIGAFSEKGDAETAGLATDTATAIYGGTLYMASSYLNALVFDLQHSHSCRFELFLTGGDAPLLLELINGPVEYVEDLVLAGMVHVKESIKNS